MDISNLTKQFGSQTLNLEDMAKSPFEQFGKWFNERVQTPCIEPTAMTLATTNSKHQVSIRTVLMKSFDEQGFTFYTNYHSTKAKQIDENNQVALLFQWLDFKRQINIQGVAKRVSKAQSAKYFLSRPYGSQLSALASVQSSVIANRDVLEKKVHALKEQYQEQLPTPDFWGGYQVIPEQMEFWQGRDDRLHDRFRYRRQNNRWLIEQLAP